MTNKTKYKRQKQKQEKEIKPRPEKSEPLEIELPPLKSFDEMPSIPSVPTDNLYKFIATVGVIGLILSIGVPIYTTIPNNEKKDRLYMDIAIQATELDNLKSYKDTLDARMRRSSVMNGNNQGGSFQITSSSVDTVNPSVGSIGLLSEYYRITAERDSVYLLKTEFVRQFNTISQSDSVYRRLSLITSIISLFLIGIGFYFWFNRLQLYIDIRNRIESGYKINGNNDLIALETKSKIQFRTFIITFLVVIVILFLLNKHYVHSHSVFEDHQGSKIIDNDEGGYFN